MQHSYNRPILIFDSGIGGLASLKLWEDLLSFYNILYVSDDAWFPYGDKPDSVLAAHLKDLLDDLISRYEPCLCIIACNTAATLLLPQIKRRYTNLPVVGVRPDLVTAVRNSQSKLVSVLATPATIKRPYLLNLAKRLAPYADLNLVGSPNLARLAEEYIYTGSVDVEAIKKELLPVFKKKGGRQTDMVVLGCTHYGFLDVSLSKIAPWPVAWYDSALQLRSVITTALPINMDISYTQRVQSKEILLTSGRVTAEQIKLFNRLGFKMI